MTTPTEIYMLNNGSIIEVKCTYPDVNDPLTFDAIVEAMEHIGLFDGIFDKKIQKEQPANNPSIDS